MNRTSLPQVFVLIASIAVLSACAQAQQAGPGITAASTTQAMPSNVMAFSDTLPGQADGPITATFALYPDAQSTTPAWTETQVVQVTQGKYTVLLGAATTNGVPSDIFAADQAHWLGVQINGTEKRYLLVSVPYAMKAMEAERLGGLLASQFVTTAQLQAALQASATSGSSTTTSGGTKTTSGPVANASLNPPEPATDFTDNNTTEVLLVTQQGTGFAIHAISAGDAALFGENTTPTGTAVKALASGTSGANIGLLAQSASPNGIAGVFDNTGGGQILSLRANGNEVAAVDNFGNFRANKFSGLFSGDGSQLFNISPFAVGATAANSSNSVVMRDPNGNFSANVISGLFSGDGSRLFNIPPFAVGAQSDNVPNAIVMRDFNGNFSASVISGLFSGDGSRLFNIPPFAVGAQSNNIPGAIVVRDFNGNFSASVISGLFSGDGSRLFNIPPFAVGAQSTNIPNAIVTRDASGNFSAGLISANGISSAGPITGVDISATATQGVPAVHGSADGGFGIQASTQYGYGLWAEATSTQAVGTALVLTHASAGKLISGGTGAFPLLNSETFSVDGSGNITFNGGLMKPYETTGTWAAGSLVKLTSNQGTLGEGTVTVTSPGDTSGVVGIITGVPSGSSMTQIARSGQSRCNFDGNAAPIIGNYVGISKTTAGDCADIGPNYPNDGQQVIGRVLSSFGTVLLFDSELHSSAGGGVAINTGAGLTGGPITSSGTISIANNSVTNAMLAPNAVSSANIADGSLPPAKIAGTAATLGTNTFTGTQNIPVINTGSITASGNINTSNLFSSNGGTFTGALVVNTSVGTALALVGGDSNNPGIAAVNALGGPAVQGTSTANNGIGIVGRTSGGQSVAGLFVNTQGNGRIISAGTGSGTFGSEVFSVDTAGNVFNGGALVASFPGSIANNTLSGLAKLDANGFAVSTAPGDTSGAVGVVLPLGGTTSSVRIAYGGTAFCVFDSAPHIGNYVQISRTTTGGCSDVGPTYPASGQVIGRVTGVSFGAGGFVLLSGPSTQSVKAGILTINTGAGLTGGPITSSGTISIANGGVTNSMLQNNSVTVSPGLGLSGGGTVPLGGSIALSNTGALSFNGRTGSILSAPGDYSFGQIAGTATSAQLPSSVVYNNQSNVFGGDQFINGGLTTNSLNTTSLTATSLTTNSLNSAAASIAGASNGQTSVLSVSDNSAANNAAALSVSSVNNQAAFFFSVGPNILSAGTATHNVLGVTSSGMSVLGNVSATTFSGDGSALTNVNASSIGGTTLANLATASALNAETAARQSGDTTLQNSINSESSARLSADASLATSISAETAARQADTTNLQTSINNVSAADAKLATANTFTASNTFAGGTQDFSAAGATLPVRALPGAQTPATCVASKELLIKTDAPAGQQLFLCDAGGTTWNLVGDGASGGVTSFNGRNGTVNPSSGDYSFNLISGSVATSQLPASVVYNNQANTFSASQTVTGNLTATSFTGNGGGLSNVNAAALNGLTSTSFAQLAASSNTFTGGVTAASFSGNGSALTNVNAATVNNFQMLKLTASITPATVNHQICSEQSFTVSGVNSSDVLLSAQPSGHSPGTNIAIGGWRVSASNTVAIQFCNASSGTSTPTAGTYIFALMR